MTLACAITDPVGHSIVLRRSRLTTTYCTSVPSALSGVGDGGGDGGGDGEAAAEHMVGSERLGGERQERRGGGSKVGVMAGTSASVHAESRACSESSPTRIRSAAERTQCKERDGRPRSLSICGRRGQKIKDTKAAEESGNARPPQTQDPVAPADCAWQGREQPHPPRQRARRRRSCSWRRFRRFPHATTTSSLLMSEHRCRLRE